MTEVGGGAGTVGGGRGSDWETVMSDSVLNSKAEAAHGHRGMISRKAEKDGVDVQMVDSERAVGSGSIKGSPLETSTFFAGSGIGLGAPSEMLSATGASAAGFGVARRGGGGGGVWGASDLTLLGMLKAVTTASGLPLFWPGGGAGGEGPP